MMYVNLSNLVNFRDFTRILYTVYIRIKILLLRVQSSEIDTDSINNSQILYFCNNGACTSTNNVKSFLGNYFLSQKYLFTSQTMPRAVSDGFIILKGVA